jgi:hypothetical protein
MLWNMSEVDGAANLIKEMTLAGAPAKGQKEEVRSKK